MLALTPLRLQLDSRAERQRFKHKAGLPGYWCNGDLSPSGDAYKEREYQKEAAYEPWNPPERRIIHVEARVRSLCPTHNALRVQY